MAEAVQTVIRFSFSLSMADHNYAVVPLSVLPNVAFHLLRRRDFVENSDLIEISFPQLLHQLAFSGYLSLLGFADHRYRL